jgi:hypothetical protein
MPFSFVRISSVRSPCWQVRQDGPAGRLLGTVAEESGALVASVVIAGKLHNQYFTDREKAAAWLLSIAPKMRR